MNSMNGNTGAAGSAQQGNAAGYYKEKIPKGYSAGKLQQFTPEQIQLFQQNFSHLGPDSYLSRLAGGDQSMFEEMEAPAMRQFQELQGGLASRFSGSGMGARRGSGFQNTQNQATSDFAMQLQSQRQSLRRQAIDDLMGFSNQLLNQRPYQNTLQPKQQQESSGWGGLIGAGIGGLGGFAIGGPAGAMGGAQLGYNVGSGF